MSSTDPLFLKLGLIGHPVSHSLSPLMHRAAISFCGLAGSYDLIDLPPEHLAAAMPKLKDTFSGFNVTVPHKQTVMRFMDQLTPEASRVRAVNTVKIDRDTRQAVGHNTDMRGFLNAVAALSADGGNFSSACIVGAGGGARAALWALAESGTRTLAIVARSAREARQMRDEFVTSANSPMNVILRSPGEPLNMHAPSLIVNCTPIGLNGEAVPEWYESLMSLARRGDAQPVFFDMVYARGSGVTPLVELARNRGFVAEDGLQMLIEQAVLAFSFWTGIDVDAKVMSSGISAVESPGC